MLDKKQIRELIKGTIYDIGLWSEEAEQLVYETGMVESRYTYLRQLGGGVARSFFQVEPFTARDNIQNFCRYRNTLMEKLSNVCHIDTNHLLSLIELDYFGLLEGNIKFAICMARIKYRRVPKKLPPLNDKEARAKYWLKYYNAGGKGSIEHYLKSIEKL
jgi:hypothetical protein